MNESTVQKSSHSQSQFLQNHFLGQKVFVHQGLISRRHCTDCNHFSQWSVRHDQAIPNTLGMEEPHPWKQLKFSKDKEFQLIFWIDYWMFLVFIFCFLFLNHWSCRESRQLPFKKSNQSIHLVRFTRHCPRKDGYWADCNNLFAAFATWLQPKCGGRVEVMDFFVGGHHLNSICYHWIISSPSHLTLQQIFMFVEDRTFAILRRAPNVRTEATCKQDN